MGDKLAKQAERNTIFLANPPFANFKPEERERYRRQGVELRFMNRAAEMLWRTIPKLSAGSVFGVVLPQTFLHSVNAAEVRRFLVAHCELQEICLFPDKVFSFSDAESAIILGRRLPAHSRRRLITQYRHVREPQMPTFRASFEASRTEAVRQSQFIESEECSLRVPDLAELWATLGDKTVLNTIAKLGQGLIYHGTHLPKGAVTYSDERFARAVQGFVHFDSGLELNKLPTLRWMNLSDVVIRRPVSGTTTGVPQILLNYARVSRGPWRLKGLIDKVGRPVTSRFIVIRPRDQSYSLEVLWALINSPVANAYAYTHLSKRDNIVGDIRRIPIPTASSFTAVDRAARNYLAGVADGREPTELQSLFLQIDVEVLKLYSFSADLERALLDLFGGYNRVGVPFVQRRYIPDELDYPICLSDFLQFEADWSATNRDRGRLIDKDIAGTISANERVRLGALQAYADYYLEKTVPRPTRMLDKLENQLIAVSGEKRSEPDARV